MAQYYRATITPGATQFVSEQLGGKIANISYRETAGVAATVILEGSDGTSSDSLIANGAGIVRGKPLSQVKVSGNGATVIIDARGPTEEIDPRLLGLSTNVTSSVQKLQFATGIGVTYTYTTPTGTRAYLIRAAGANATGGGITANVRVFVNGGTPVDEFVMNAGTINANSTSYIGTMSTDTVVLPAGGLPLLAGDVLTFGSGATITWDIEIWQVPM